MIELWRCIPSVDEVLRQLNRPEDEKPTQAVIDRIADDFLASGYRDDNPEVFRAIVEYGAAELEKKNTRGLFLKGVSGIGKTAGIRLLAAKFKWPVLTARQIQGVFTQCESDLHFLEFIDAQNEFDEIQTLVIDDIGTEDCPVVKFGTQTNVIATALERRYEYAFTRFAVRTIVTTNLTDAELRQRYGYRIDDRLNEMFTFRQVNGKSLRK